jgi:Fic family protein
LGEIEPLLLIPTYILDFVCIHPFLDGNGRMARLLTLLLLYKAGYEVGRFISLEQIVERTKESSYDTLYHSSQGWHEEQHNLLPGVEVFLGSHAAISLSGV